MRFVPDDGFADLYERFSVEKTAIANDLGRASEVRNLSSELTNAANSLSRPELRASDLIGWTRAIYERLPKGKFTNSDIYRYESELQYLFPDNKNIKPKIRQQLQVLRDMGVLKHLSRAQWERIERTN